MTFHHARPSALSSLCLSLPFCPSRSLYLSAHLVKADGCPPTGGVYSEVSAFPRGHYFLPLCNSHWEMWGVLINY